MTSKLTSNLMSKFQHAMDENGYELSEKIRNEKILQNEFYRKGLEAMIEHLDTDHNYEYIEKFYRVHTDQIELLDTYEGVSFIVYDILGDFDDEVIGQHYDYNDIAAAALELATAFFSEYWADTKKLKND